MSVVVREDGANAGLLMPSIEAVTVLLSGAVSSAADEQDASVPAAIAASANAANLYLMMFFIMIVCCYIELFVIRR
jgi:hypothetical protein